MVQSLKATLFSVQNVLSLYVVDVVKRLCLREWAYKKCEGNIVDAVEQKEK